MTMVRSATSLHLYKCVARFSFLFSVHSHSHFYTDSQNDHEQLIWACYMYELSFSPNYCNLHNDNLD